MSPRMALGLLIVALLAGGCWWWTHRPAPIRNNPPRSGPIVAFGDSLTFGIGAGGGEGSLPAADQSYPDQLAKLIGRPVINCGHPGDTIAAAAGRVDDDVLAENPSIVIVLLGGNDYLQRKDQDTSFQELERLIGRIQDGGAMVILVGMESLIPFGGAGKRYRELADRTGTVFVPDILDGIMGHPDLMSDRIHPNAQGYAIMAERVARKLRPYLN